MNIAVIGASGRLGGYIVNEALARGHKVTGIARSKNRVQADIPVLEKDIQSLTKQDLEEFDAVADAFGVWDAASFYLYPDTTRHLADILSGTGVYLLVVGGAGTLYADAAHTRQVWENFTGESRHMVEAMAEALDILKASDGLRWTSLSPAFDFEPDLPRTGSYQLGGEEPIANSQGESELSYADYAAAMVDEMETPQHEGRRFSVVGP